MQKTRQREQNFWKAMGTLALPIAIQNLLSSSFTLVDTLMVGRLGDVSLAAVGMAGQWSWLFNMLTFGIASGAAVFFAQFYGEGNRKGFIHTYGLALSLGLFFSVLFMGIGFFWPSRVIEIFNRDAAVLSVGSAYLKIAVFSYPAIILNMLINMVLRASERVRLPMTVSVFTTALNAALDYGLIFGAFGLPQLGLRGAAVATVISAWSGPLILLLILAFGRDGVFFAPIQTLFGFDKAFFKTFFRYTFPVMMNETLWGLGCVAYNAIFSNLGYEYAAAVSILRTFENLAFSFFVGMTNAASVIIGHNVGSGQIHAAVKNAARCMIAVPLGGLLVGILVLFFRGSLVSVFNIGGNISEKTLLAAQGILLIYALELAVRNIPYVTIVGVFRSGGDTKNGMKIEMLCLWGVSVPLTFIAAFVLKLPFVWVFLCSYLCEDYLKAFLCLRHYKSGNWLKPVTEAGRLALARYRSQKEAGAK